METVGDITGRIYEAAVNPGFWQSVLSDLSDTIGCLDIALCSYSINADTSISLASGFMGGKKRNPEVHHLYSQHYAALAPMNRTSLRVPTGHLHFCHENVPNAIRKRHPFYQEFVVPHGGQFMAACVLDRNPTSLLRLALHTRDEPLQRDQLVAFLPLFQHIRDSVRLSEKFCASIDTAQLLNDALKQRGAMAFLVDEHARVLECFGNGAQLLERGEIVQLRLGRLCLPQNRDLNFELHRRIASACMARGGGAMSVPNQNGRPPSDLEIIPSGVNLQSRLWPLRTHCALVCLHPPSTEFLRDPESIRFLIGCTRAEAEIAAFLVAGLSPSQIAKNRQVRITTVRTQIQRLLALTNVRRISELVSRLCTRC
jgi:DNA-binding CsgD family transcriptional regulator